MAPRCLMTPSGLVLPPSLLLVLVTMCVTRSFTEGHQDGCQGRHGCPSDQGSYECGDTGHCSQCPNNRYCSAGERLHGSAAEHSATTPLRSFGLSAGQGAFAEVAEEQVVQETSGNGTRNLRPFKVRDHWEIRWHAKDGDIAIFITNPNSGVPQQAAGQDKPGSGSSYQPKGGTYFLRVVATGDWTVTIVQLP